MPVATTTLTQTNGHTLRLRGDGDSQAKAKTDTHKHDLAANPFQRVWRGDRVGTIKMPGVPTFEDKHEERTWVKQHMAACFRYWGKMGFGEGTAGHITVRDPVLTDHYWMNPFGMHFSLIKVSQEFRLRLGWAREEAREHKRTRGRYLTSGVRSRPSRPGWLRDRARRSAANQ